MIIYIRVRDASITQHCGVIPVHDGTSHLIELAKRYQEIHMHAVQHVRQIKVLCVTAQEYFPEFPDLLEEHDGETYQECMNDIKVSFEKAHKYFITYVEHVQEVCNELNEVL